MLWKLKSRIPKAYMKRSESFSALTVIDRSMLSLNGLHKAVESVLYWKAIALRGGGDGNSHFSEGYVVPLLFECTYRYFSMCSIGRDKEGDNKH